MSLGSRRPVGASTITQQVAKNMLLTNEVSIERKVKEAILAYRIEDALTKQQILELYLNEIPLGRRSFGVQVAVHDPWADAEQARHEYGVELLAWDQLPRADAIVAAVAHREYAELTAAENVIAALTGGTPPTPRAMCSTPGR